MKMEKIIGRLSTKISAKPLISMMYVFLLSVIFTTTLLWSTNLKNTLVSDGIYAVKSSRLIELRGDAELPLYEEAVNNIGSEIPAGLSLCIYSGFGTYLQDSKFQDLVYRGGVLKGDFYQTSIMLSKRKRGINYYETINCSNEFNDEVNDKFNRRDREQMVVSACNRLLTQWECDKKAQIDN